jgi:electron-transferring-flavoprotein dehydrogenase
MATAPIEFPPPVEPENEFVAQPTDPEDERIEVGVVIVGGGPGGLACAIRLTQLLAEDEALMESLGEVPVALVEKGKSPGSHLLSGAMMNPSAMQRLFPDLDESEWPTYGSVGKDAVYLLPNGKRSIPLHPIPPPFKNHGNHVTSVAQLGRWLSQRPRRPASTSWARPPPTSCSWRTVAWSACARATRAAAATARSCRTSSRART